MDNQITVIIHTHNEERSLEACIASAKLLASTIVVIDMESTDRTVEIARTAHIPVFSFPHSLYVEPSRYFGIQHAKSRWVFMLDADERITKEFAGEVKGVILTTSHTYFKIPRKNIFGGVQWLRHGGWWPDYTMGRLLNKESFIDWPKEIHSTPHMNGTCGELRTPFLHYFHGNLSSMVHKTLIYEDIEAGLLHGAQRPVRTATFFRKFVGELTRRLIFKAGFLDGTFGIIESVYQAFSKTITWILLFEKKFVSNNKLE